MTHWGEWAASFVDGPCEGELRIFAVGPIAQRFYLAQMPPDMRFVLVGINEAPAAPWPNQISYRLLKTLGDGDDATAYFELVNNADTP